MTNWSASGFSSRSGRMPWLAVIAAMREPPQIRPDHARPDETEMRGHENPVDLLVGVVGEREHHPVRSCAAIASLHHDAADDAVLAGGGGDLDQVAIGAVALDHRRQVDGRSVEGHPHGFHGRSRRSRYQDADQQGDENVEDVEGSAQRASVPAGRALMRNTAQLVAQSYRRGGPRTRRAVCLALRHPLLLGVAPRRMGSRSFAAKTSR